ncbi:MAG: hypothetical protein PUC47_00060, partial [Oscillospiraceae bacterium]|nr:hypothetical protein [Oscillospiraceae bacterium]
NKVLLDFFQKIADSKGRALVALRRARNPAPPRPARTINTKKRGPQAARYQLDKAMPASSGHMHFFRFVQLFLANHFYDSLKRCLAGAGHRFLYRQKRRSPLPWEKAAPSAFGGITC